VRPAASCALAARPTRSTSRAVTTPRPSVFAGARYGSLSDQYCADSAFEGCARACPTRSIPMRNEYELALDDRERSSNKGAVMALLLPG